VSHLSGQTLAQLNQGTLARDEALAARRHLTSCDACAALAEKAPSAAVERTLGRYVLLDEVGRGGMGRVLRGFDPQLDRFVAIKRLLDSGGTDARERLVREAQAMARVVHPHLVSVFDAGLDAQGEVYLVMEYVKGPTLAQWLTEAPRTWRDVLRCFTQAGLGLAAAHAAGLVHRDFKPSNVLVAGEVAKVTDFGLALAQASTVASPTSSEHGRSRISSRVTEAGVHAGTPAYMAPEQFEGRFDPRSDQFSFARSLEESLTGRSGPGWLHEALRRALHVDPAQRYPSMVALLDALAPERRRRRLTVLAGAGLAVALVVTTAAVARSKQVDCARAAAGLEAVWSDAAQAGLERVLSPSEAGVRQATRARFEAWADTWRSRSVGNCEASAAGTQGEKVELLRRGCLQRRLGFLGTVLGQVASGRVATEQVVTLSAELPEVGCTDEDLLEAGVADESEALRAQLEPVRARFDEVEALALVGRLEEATAKAKDVLPLAETTGHEPTLAYAALLLGQRLAMTNPSEARRLRALATREAAKVLSPSPDTATLAARAALDLLDTYATEPQAFEALRPFVDSLIARAGGGPQWEAARLTYEGRALAARGEAEAALTPLRRAYALRLEFNGKDSERAENVRGELALALENAGQVEDALALRRESLEFARTRYGTNSLTAARALASVGAVEVVAVRYADAEQHLTASLELLTAAGATENLTTLLDNLASLAELRGDFRSALPLRERLLAGERDAGVRAKQLALLSRVALEVGDEATALRSAREARSTLEAINPRHPDLIVALTTLGRLTAGEPGVVVLKQALSLDSARDGEYRGDIERALGDRTSGAKRSAWLARARASYESSEVLFRVNQLDGR